MAKIKGSASPILVVDSLCGACNNLLHDKAQKGERVEMAVVGVMYNLKGEPPEEGEPPDSQAELDSETTVLAVADALRAYGHDVCLLEGDYGAVSKVSDLHLDIVFNMCEGRKGESRESQVPAVLDMLGIPYTGSGVLALAATLDKPLAKKILTYHRVPTPLFMAFDDENEVDPQGLKFPVFVKPAREGSSKGVTPRSYCSKPLDFFREAKRLIREYKQPVLVEEYLPGREFTVGLLGNRNPLVFPVTEINFDLVPQEHGRIYTGQFKSDWFQEIYYTCPAQISEALETELVEAALATYRVFNCKDLARVDLRLDDDGVPNVIEINPLPGLAPGFSDYPRMAEKGGWTYTDLINGILECALRRHDLSHLIPFGSAKQIA